MSLFDKKLPEIWICTICVIFRKPRQDVRIIFTVIDKSATISSQVMNSLAVHTLFSLIKTTKVFYYKIDTRTNKF